MTTETTITEGPGALFFSAVLSRDLFSYPRTMLAVSRLRTGVHVRARGVDPAHVATLAEQPAPLPPIVVRAGALTVIDGLHRLHAAWARAQTEIDALLVDVTADEALLLAVELNSRHGLPLSRSDRRAAVTHILRTNADWSDRRIAKLAGVSPKTVGALRQRMSEELPHSNTRIGRDGRIWRADITARRHEVMRVLESNPHASLREVAAIAGVAASTVRQLRRPMGADTEGATDPAAEVTQHPNGHLPVEARVRRRISAAPQTHPMHESPRRSAQDEVPPGEPRSAGADTCQGEGGGTSLPQDRPAASPDDRLRDFVTDLGRLRVDPSIRGSVSGRALLRLFSMSAQDLTALDPLIQAVPPHQAPTVAHLARECAYAWLALAEAMLQDTRATTG